MTLFVCGLDRKAEIPKTKEVEQRSKSLQKKHLYFIH